MATLFSVFGVLILGGAANAEAASFCNVDEPNCVKLYVKNSASATVKSVKLTQEQGSKTCKGGVEKTIKKNVTGGTSITPGEKVAFYADQSCKYKVKFKTTSGCTGDKTTHFNSDDFISGRNLAELSGACGTLKTKTDYSEPNFQ